MGNTSSQEQVVTDPWWKSNQPQICSTQNVLLESNATVSKTYTQETHNRPCEDIRLQEATWLQRELTLGQTIQHLAEENMRLTVTRQAAEKRMEDAHVELETETQRTSEELDKLRSESEKAQQVFEKLHAQIQSGREDRQMITSEMERIRSGFDAEREAKEEVLVEMRKLREERDENRRTVETLQEELIHEKKIIEDVVIRLNQEREEKENTVKEIGRLKEELKAAKASLISVTNSLQVQNTPVQERLQTKENHEDSATLQVRSPEAKAEMARFHAEMSTRREARQRAMHAVSTEMERLRTELNTEREARKQATEKLEESLLHFDGNKKSKQEEALTLELEQVQQKLKADKKRLKQLSQENERLQFELENGQQILTQRTDDLEKLQAQLETEREHIQNQIVALKEVAAISKQMLIIREGQVLQLKDKLKDIEDSVTNRVQEKLSIDLKTEYESQMENIRNLKGLYEERMKVMLSEKEKLVHDSEEKSQHLEAEMKKCGEFEQQLTELKLSLSQKEEENSNLQIQLDDSHDKSKRLANELSHINNIFTQMLVGSTATDMDLDKLTRLLQENHDLITEITIKEDSSEAASTLPKLLLDIVAQVDSNATSSSSSPTGERNEDNQARCTSLVDSPVQEQGAEDGPGNQGKSSSDECANGMAIHDIALNLPKVWKVLMELLSHHVVPSSVEDHEDNENSCYKSIDTPSGPRLVISVSKTFIRLKDLILEKKSLQKELTRLKQLNGHLECKLNDQENKVSLVSSELRKTWNVVDRMQTQHQQLHTHEKILRYELQEKRKMLTELKQELEYCREKWERARQKNSESEVEWKKLRKEFASRKTQPLDLLNNSGESGFSDGRGDDSCEDDDATSKDTGQLDPSIEEISELHVDSEDIRTSSPLETNFPQPPLINSTGILEPPSSNFSLGQSELLLHEPILSGTTIMQASASCEHVELLNPSQPELLLNLEAEALTNTEYLVSQGDELQDTCLVQPHSSSVNLNSFTSSQCDTKQEHVSDCRIEPTDNVECSTISLITLLKQQLSFFSKNLDHITMGTDDISEHNLQALESIFTLPPIQIPKPINDTITKEDCFPSFYCCGQETPFQFTSSPLLSSISSTPDLPTDEVVENLVSGKDIFCEASNIAENTQNMPEHDTSKETNNIIECSVEGNIMIEESKVGSNSSNQQCPQSNSISSERSHTSGSVQSSQEHSRLNRTPEEIAEARAARLKRLEEQCQQLYNRVSRTTHRSTALCNRLEELHEQYGNSESSSGVRTQAENNNSSIPVPPPLPHILRARRIPTAVVLTQRTDSGELSDLTGSTSTSPFHHIQIPTDNELNQRIDSVNIPSPPPFPNNQSSRRIPTCLESISTQSNNAEELSGRVTIPTPPPLPQNLRGTRLPTCFIDSQSNSSDLHENTMYSANETTTRSSSIIQRQEELLQEATTSNSSSEVTNDSDSKSS